MSKIEEVKKVEVSADSVEAMAENIEAIAKAARSLEVRLTRRTILLLIQDQTGGSKRGISLENIAKVLDGLQSLNVYVKPKKKSA